MMILIKVIAEVHTGKKALLSTALIAIHIYIDRILVELYTSEESRMLTDSQLRPFVEFNGNERIVYRGRHIINHLLTVVRAVKTLAITIEQPVVQVTFSLYAELVHLEFSVLKAVIKVRSEASLHVHKEVEFVSFLFYICKLFKQGRARRNIVIAYGFTGHRTSHTARP